MTGVLWRRAWPLFLLGALLAVGLCFAATPSRIFDLVAQARPTGLAAAFLVTGGVAALRGVRLRLVVGSRLGLRQALGIHAVAQLATSVLPMRLGEAALLPLLHRCGVGGVLRGLSIALTIRALDVLSLLLWATVAGAWLGARGGPAGFFLVALLLALGASAAFSERALGWAARRFRRASRRRRQLLRKLLRVRGELRRLLASPRRALGAVGCSLAAWGGVWWFTLLLLRAMDLHWPAASVLWGTLGATVGAAVPLNGAGNFGTLEAGWTAALAALGIPATEALAAGFATHLWSLVFTAALAAAALPLLVTQRESARVAARPAAKASRNP